MKRILSLFAALVVCATFLVGTASAQTNTLSYDKFGTNAVGVMYAVYNVIDSTITDGTVCIYDTTTTGVKRVGVRPYAGTAITRPRIAGIAVGNIARSSSGGAGKILVIGYHPNAKMALSTGAANSLIKTGLLHGTLTTVADSLSGAVGVFLGHTSTSTAANARGKVFITRPLSVFFGSL